MNNSFFENPPNRVGEVYSQALRLFRSNIQTLALLGFLEAVVSTAIGMQFGDIVVETDHGGKILANNWERTVSIGWLLMRFVITFFDAAIVRVVGESLVLVREESSSSPTTTSRTCIGTLKCDLIGNTKSLLVYELIQFLLLLGGTISIGMITATVAYLVGIPFPQNEAIDVEQLTPKGMATCVACTLVMFVWIGCTCFVTDFATFAVILENNDGIGSLKRSWILSKSRLRFIMKAAFPAWFLYMVGLIGTTILGPAFQILIRFDVVLRQFKTVVGTVVYMSLCIHKDRLDRNEFRRLLYPSSKPATTASTSRRQTQQRQQQTMMTQEEKAEPNDNGATISDEKPLDWQHHHCDKKSDAGLLVPSGVVQTLQENRSS